MHKYVPQKSKVVEPIIYCAQYDAWNVVQSTFYFTGD